VVRVLIVDDHPIVRKGIISALADASDIVVTGEAQNAQEAMDLVRKTKFDVVLLDISLPGLSGFEVLKQWQTEFAELRVIILSTYPEDQYALRCLKAGAWGYMEKNSDSDEIIRVIRKVADGHKHVSDAVSEQLVGSIKDDPPGPRHKRLTDREFEIMCLLGRGQTVSKIASTLSLSVNTVHTYRQRILGKMNLSGTAQIMRYVLENHLIDHS
jgi:two-component system, NarL family, invasion response regulator UvrY